MVDGGPHRRHVLSFVGPLVIYLVYKDRDPFVRRHAANALNVQITLAIAYIVLAITVIAAAADPVPVAALAGLHDPRRDRGQRRASGYQYPFVAQAASH